MLRNLMLNIYIIPRRIPTCKDCLTLYFKILPARPPAMNISVADGSDL